MGSFDPSNFSVHLIGEDYTAVCAAAGSLTASLAEVEGLENVEADIALTVSQASYSVSAKKVMYYAMSGGLQPALFQTELSAVLLGAPVPGASVDGAGLLRERRGADGLEPGGPARSPDQRRYDHPGNLR